MYILSFFIQQYVNLILLQKWLHQQQRQKQSDRLPPTSHWNFGEIEEPLFEEEQKLRP